jgi:hypothetical protein
VWARGALVILRSEDRSASWRVALARAGKVEPLTRGCVCWHGRWGPGGVASGSGGEAPDPGSPRGEGSKRARTTTSTSTSTSPGETVTSPLATSRGANNVNPGPAYEPLSPLLHVPVWSVSPPPKFIRKDVVDLGPSSPPAAPRS